MIDLHSHILPGMDDGSADTEESLWLLDELARQGVTLVAATPHFYATREYPEEFLRRREQSVAQLLPRIHPAHPTIRLGAEVHYFEGISRAAGLERLCVEGTPLFLLEMPYGAWSGSMVDEVLEMNRMSEVTVVLAHVERYFAYQPKRLWDDLAANGVLFQTNAEPLTRWLKARRTLRLFREQRIHFLGSDCHNRQERPPCLSQARARIARTFGQELLREMDAGQNKWFTQSEVPVG